MRNITIANIEVFLIITVATVTFLAVRIVLIFKKKLKLLGKIKRWQERLPLASHPFPRSQRFRYTKPVVLFAHRGLSRYATENTGVACRLAALCGSNGIELDVRFTRDGVSILFHDRKLSRLCLKEPRVRDLSWDEISCARIFPANRIMSLKEFFDDFGHLFEKILLDLKDFNTGEDDFRGLDTLEQLIRAYGVKKKVILDCAALPFLEKALKRGLSASLREPKITLEEVCATGIQFISLRSDRAKKLYENSKWSGLNAIVICPPRVDAVMEFIERGSFGVITDAAEETLEAMKAGRYVVEEREQD